MVTTLGKTGVVMALFLLCMPIFLQLFRKNKRLMPVYYALVAVTVLAILYVTIFSRSIGDERIVVLIPFTSYIAAKDTVPINLAYFTNDGILTLRERTLAYAYSFQSIGLNILLFIPLGYLWKVGFLYHKRWYNAALWGMMSSLLIEIIQLVFCLGWFDIDDLINNTLGAVIGYACCSFSEWLIERNVKGIHRNDIAMHEE